VGCTCVTRPSVFARSQMDLRICRWYGMGLTILYRNPLLLHLELRVRDQQVVMVWLFQRAPRSSVNYVSAFSIRRAETVKTHH
jgi:hypothetical protein